MLVTKSLDNLGKTPHHIIILLIIFSCEIIALVLEHFVLFSSLHVKSFVYSFSFTLIQACRVDTCHSELNHTDGLLQYADRKSQPS